MISASRRVLLPPTIGLDDGPVLFLAGPIQGADDWQAEAIRIIHDTDPTIIIANPRRDYLDGTFVYEDQVDWESHHLRRAGAGGGAIMFWCAAESEHDCDRAYAQTTRFELAEWLTAAQFAEDYGHVVNVVIGIEDGFTGAKYIRHRYSGVIHTTLEETCMHAAGYLDTSQERDG